MKPKDIVLTLLLIAIVVALGIIAKDRAPRDTANMDTLVHPGTLYENATLGLRAYYPDGFLLLSDKDAMASSGYLPVCNSERGDACLSMPKEAYPNSNFDGAGVTFGVIGEAASEETCYAILPNSNETKTDTITENGITWMVFTNGDAAMSHRSDGKDYRAFANGRCYEIETRIATTVYEVYEPGTIVEFTDADKASVEVALDGIVASITL